MASSLQQLDPDKIIDTVARLSRRIRERFPDAGLNNVCQKLLEIARRARTTASEIDAPITWARVLSGVIIAALLTIIVIAIVAVFAEAAEEGQPRLSAGELVQVIEATGNELVAIGITIFFLVSLESRLKRRRALKAIHELRVIAHIIDMHQLTKDPERLTGPATESSPRRTMTPFLLNRYLDYCSEMLALTGKLGVLYVQNFPDQQAVSAVNAVEALTDGLSRKIWQKIVILHNQSGAADRPAFTPPSAAGGLAE